MVNICNCLSKNDSNFSDEVKESVCPFHSVKPWNNTALPIANSLQVVVFKLHLMRCHLMIVNFLEFKANFYVNM